MSANPTADRRLEGAALGQQLHADAADALVRWRQRWERESCSPPSTGAGFTCGEITLWRIAGKIMKHRGIERSLP